MRDLLRQQWLDLRQRLSSQVAAHASFSLRLPGEKGMWWGRLDSPEPLRIDWTVAPVGDAQAHVAIYRVRHDVGAILLGGGAFGNCLADFGGVMPILFDEQARHLGHMATPVGMLGELAEALRLGGNAVLVRGVPACLGATGTRMALNAELFEKCAKAYTLAEATGARITHLPWWVAFIANGRLMKDEKRAARCFANGQLPPESRGY
ncbi:MULTISPECIES: hypothetical protein [unclassified Pseudomonas]|uniref:hypothetical protein n=1 Tax=unclassified Pseudomonas TaxID=196821 RepID=UPI000C2F89D3|nr:MULTISPECIES: hypothetical protein [unclassified Pseudomonas]MCU1739314.1 hypothetical protein [Pseudomonas sp. 20S_6.2_Bac1]